MTNERNEQTEHPIELTHFAGHDWAKDHHDVVVVDQTGTIVLDLRIPDTAEGWHTLRSKLSVFGTVAVAIETRSGAAVEQLLEAGLIVFPINPKATKRYRERKAPSGTKTDRLEAWALADALRLDGRDWKSLRPEDPLIQELRLLCRDEVGLIEQRTALVNQLQQALYEYYPAVLEAFDDWTEPFTWAFVEMFPTPQALFKAGKRKWEKFLHSHKLYRAQTYEKRLAIFARATEFCGRGAITAAKSRLALVLAKQLRVLQGQLDDYHQRIQQLFDQHPDSGMFGSLPGLGEKLAPRLMSELGDDRGRFEDHQALQCYAGTAPISFQSGQICRALFRRACNKRLRTAVHLWANLSRRKCAWAEVYYRQKRDEGKSHACALRCLGQRWLKILWKMWQTKTHYDEQLHTRNQVRHGSWVLAITTEKH
jgi:transposase